MVLSSCKPCLNFHGAVVSTAPWSDHLGWEGTQSSKSIQMRSLSKSRNMSTLYVLARRVEGLSGVMDENRARLAERGEKLRTLQDKMEAMSGDAEDFASLARQLREREANKKWWQL